MDKVEAIFVETRLSPTRLQHIWKRGRKAIASDLKSDDRKVMWVRILPLP